jgi:hypothetical protein
MNILALGFVALSAFSLALPFMETDLNEAKALFFDRKYEESRTKWAEIAAAKGPSSEAATYWIARCSESLGESERAFREYGAFLDLPPTDARLAEEAEISRIGLATKLTRAGKAGYLTAVLRSLGDDRAPVRHFGALQVASLPNLPDARKATAVLREIVKSSKDTDIVERAKLQLLRLEPRSLAEVSPPREPRPASTPRVAARPTEKKEPEGMARLLRIRISKGGKQTVAVTVPFSLAEFVFLEAASHLEHPRNRVDRGRRRRDDRNLGGIGGASSRGR